MKNKDPIQVNDLSFQVDLINPKKLRKFKKERDATNNARLWCS